MMPTPTAQNPDPGLILSHTLTLPKPSAEELEAWRLGTRDAAITMQRANTGDHTWDRYAAIDARYREAILLNASPFKQWYATAFDTMAALAETRGILELAPEARRLAAIQLAEEEARRLERPFTYDPTGAEVDPEQLAAGEALQELEDFNPEEPGAWPPRS